MATKKQIEKCCINAINRYYGVADEVNVGICDLCHLIDDCNKCPFSDGNGCLTGTSSRFGMRGSDKSKWQSELIRRYNNNAEKLGLTELVVIEGEE